MLTVIYEPEGTSENYPDGEVMRIVADVVTDATLGNSVTFYTGQELAIDCVRVCILENLIPYNEVHFRYKNFLIIPDKYGHLDSWPDGFCDYRDKLLERLLRDTFLKFKEEG